VCKKSGRKKRKRTLKNKKETDYIVEITSGTLTRRAQMKTTSCRSIDKRLSKASPGSSWKRKLWLN